MARSEARLQFDLWREGLDGLSAHAKLFYCVLLTEPTLNHAGVGAVRFTRWARNASLTEQEADKALAELQDGQFVFLDDDTEEVLVRTLIRNDGVAEQPYVLKGALANALGTKSRWLRWVLAQELRKLPPKRPDAVSEKTGRTIVYPDPQGAADLLDPPGSTPPPDPRPKPSTDPSETLFEPSRQGPAEKPFREPVEREGGRGGGRGGGSSKSVGTHLSSAPKRADEQREDVEALCRHLRDRIVGNGRRPPTNSAANTWRRAARLLLDRDRRPLDEAHRLIDWCQDDDFWRSNIGGMPKFREKYDDLRLRAQADNGRRHLAAVPNAYQSVDAAYADLLDRADARAAARLIGASWMDEDKPPSVPGDPLEWSRERRRTFIREHETQVRAALSERKTG